MAHSSQDRRDATDREAGAASPGHEQGSDSVESADQPDEHVPLGDDDSVVNGSDSGGVSPEGAAQMPTRSDRIVDEVCSWPPLRPLTSATLSSPRRGKCKHSCYRRELGRKHSAETTKQQSWDQNLSCVGATGLHRLRALSLIDVKSCAAC